MEEKEIKRWLKRKVRVTFSLLISFLICGKVIYAAEPTVQELQQQIQGLQSKIEQIEEKNKEIENKNKEIEEYFKSEKIEIGKNAKANGKESVAIGKDSLASTDKSVAIGHHAHIYGNGGNSDGTGTSSIAIGDNALITTNGLNLTSIAIGKNAKVLNGSGKQEAVLSFTPDNYNSSSIGMFTRNTLPKNADKTPGGIAIGANSYARTASVQIGNHTMEDYIMGGVKITKSTNDSEANIVGMTTIGTNTYNKGALASMLGAYSVITGEFTGEGGFNSFKYGSQNFGASIIGSLNSIRSKGANGSAGVANSIVGLANIAEDTNGTLIYGAGNSVKHSNEKIGGVDAFTGKIKGVDEFVSDLQKGIKDSKSGGATLVIGGGNEAEYTKQVTMIGTNNTIKGTSGKKSSLIMLAGHNNNVSSSSEIIAYGSNFEVSGSNNILFGFNDNKNKVENKKVVSIGNNIKVSDDYSVYLGDGAGSSGENNSLWNKIKGEKKKLNKAIEEKKQTEEIKKEINEKYKEYAHFAGFSEMRGVVSVGNENLTRILQNVAPGLISSTSTDAINGSQLYHFINKGITIKDGKGNSTTVKLGDTLTLKGTTVDVTVKAPEPAQPNTSKPATPTPGTTSVAPQPAPGAPKQPKVQEHTATFEAKGKFEYVLREGDAEKVLSEEEYSKLKSDEKKNVILRVKDDEKVITNVAKGVKYNDAVNVSQLKAVSEEVEKNSKSITEINNNIVGIKKDINKVDKKADLALGGVANAVAMANLVQVNSYSDYRHNLSAAYGYYGGSHALAIGFSGVTKDRRLVYKLSGSVNNKGNLAFGVGAGVMLGNKEESMEHKDINVKELYEKISKLEKENSEFREMFKKLGVMK